MKRLMLAAGTAMLALTGAAPARVSPPEQATPATSRWATFRDAYIEELFRLDPGFALYQGHHDFDGRVQDWSRRG